MVIGRDDEEVREDVWVGFVSAMTRPFLPSACYLSGDEYMNLRGGGKESNMVIYPPLAVSRLMKDLLDSQ